MLWQNGSTIYTWGSFVIHAILSVTQLLSIFGILVEINMMMWGYGPMVMEAISAVAGIMMFLQYNNAYGVLRDDIDDGETTIDDATAYAVAEGIQMEMIEMAVMQASAILSLWVNMENWMKAQWWALPEEDKKAKYWEMQEKDKKDDDMKDMLLRRSLDF